MPRISDAQLAPPQNWEEFEDICFDLWKVIWKDSKTQKNGRKGQPQSGVDIYGRPSSLDGYTGLQCKGKDNYSKSKLTKKEIDKEIEKAKTFKPPLKKFIIATTQLREVKLQEYVRFKNEQNINNSSFEICISFWEDIKAELENHIGIVKKYWPLFFPGEGTTGIYSEEQININIQKETEVNTFSLQQGTINIQNIYQSSDSLTSIFTDKYNSDIDYARDLIIKHRPGEAISFLNNLKKKIWDDANSQLRFRILTNLASSHLALNDIEISAKLYIEVLQYNPDDEKALTNVALGYLLLKKFSESKSYSECALKKNPASGRAYSIYLQAIALDRTIEEIEKEISPVVKDDPEVLHALGFICRTKENFTKAESYLEKAYLNKKEDQIEIVNSYATILLENIIQNNPIIFNQALTDNETVKLGRALELLNQVWGSYKDSSIRKSKIGTLVNRSILERIFKDYWGAISDIDEVIRTKGEKPEYIKFKALLLIDVKDSKNAIALLEKIQLNDKAPESDLILAGLLVETNKLTRAIKILEERRERLQNGKLKQDINSTLVDLYLKQKDFDKASKLSEALYQENPDSVNSLITISKVLKANGKDEQSHEKLLAAINFCNNLKDKFLLAEELFENELFEQAAVIYESFVNIKENNHLVRKMVGSFYYSGQLGKALQICVGLRENYQPLRFITEIEIDIYERIGDLQKAVTIATDYLIIYPDDLRIKVRNAFICLRQRDFTRVDEFLETVTLKDYMTLPLEYFQKISLLYSERGKSLESLNTLYEARRNFFNSSNTHMVYISAFFMREAEFDQCLDDSIVEVDCAVQIKDRLGNMKWYVIEEREDVNYAKNEISLNHSLAKQMLGERVGDSVAFVEGEEIYNITEIKSKYVYALHESLSLYPQLFPERQDFHSIMLESKNEALDNELNFEPVFKQIDELDKYVKQAEQLYLNSSLTIGGLSNYLHRNAFEVISGLMEKKEVGIRCCLGKADERVNAIELLSKYKSLVIDVISLLIINEFRLEKKLSTVYSEIFVTRSTIDLLNESISLKRGFTKRGYMSISREENHYVRTEIDASTIQKSIEFHENFIDWITENFTIAPCNEALNIPRDNKQKLDRVFQVHFIDAVLLAKEKKALLYSDDYKLRHFANHKYQVQGFWTQVILIDLLNKGIITEDEYEKYLVKLATSYFKHTSITSKTLITSLQMAEWLPAPPFLEVADILDGRNSDLNSSTTVVIGFLKELKEQPIMPERRHNIIFALLDKLSAYRNPKIVIDKLIIELNHAFLLLPLYNDELLQDIDAWTKVKFS